MLSAAQHGIGCAVLPYFIGDPASGVVRLGSRISALASELWLLTHPDLRHVTRIRALLDFLAKALRSQSVRLAG